MTDAKLVPIAKRKNPAAVALGRLGGQVGGKRRWEGVSAKERTAHAKRAVAARAAKRKKSKKAK